MENEDLKSQLAVGLYGSKGLRSTNHNSINYGDVSYNFDRNENPSLTAANFYVTPIRQAYSQYGTYPIYNSNSEMNGYDDHSSLSNELD